MLLPVLCAMLKSFVVFPCLVVSPGVTCLIVNLLNAFPPVYIYSPCFSLVLGQSMFGVPHVHVFSMLPVFPGFYVCIFIKLLHLDLPHLLHSLAPTLHNWVQPVFRNHTNVLFTSYLPQGFLASFRCAVTKYFLGKDFFSVNFRCTVTQFSTL